MADGFLSRWSRAKTIDKSIREQQGQSSSSEISRPEVSGDQVSMTVPEAVVKGPEPVTEPAPSMEDAKALGVGDDVSRFMGAHVAAEVRSLALRKLFSMPHYNIRSDMDVYSEDFFNMPKLTAAEVANLQQSESLSLFEDPPWRKEMLQEEADKRAADAAAGIDQEAVQQATVSDEPAPENLVSEEQMPHNDVELGENLTRKPGQDGEANS
ncbi:MAG: DUF3306 domain-containing protein [Burkholderiaceae bacterium]